MMHAHDDDYPDGYSPIAHIEHAYETYVCTEYGRMMGALNGTEHGGPYISTELLDLLRG